MFNIFIKKSKTSSNSKVFNFIAKTYNRFLQIYFYSTNIKNKTNNFNEQSLYISAHPLAATSKG